MYVHLMGLFGNTLFNFSYVDKHPLFAFTMPQFAPMLAPVQIWIDRLQFPANLQISVIRIIRS